MRAPFFLRHSVEWLFQSRYYFLTPVASICLQRYELARVKLLSVGLRMVHGHSTVHGLVKDWRVVYM